MGPAHHWEGWEGNILNYIHHSQSNIRPTDAMNGNLGVHCQPAELFTSSSSPVALTFKVPIEIWVIRVLSDLMPKLGLDARVWDKPDLASCGVSLFGQFEIVKFQKTGCRPFTL